MSPNPDPMLEMIDDVYLLALVVWYEARGESREGKLAVAWSVLNRVSRPSWWGDSIQAVIRKKWQYSSMTDPNDSQFKVAKKLIDILPARTDQRWKECLTVALGAYDGTLPNPAPGADSYFADTISPPKWADEGKFVVKIGHHSFYDLDSDYER